MVIDNHKNKLIRRTDIFIVVISFLAVSPFFSTIVNFYLFYFLVFVFFISLKRKIILFNQKIFLLLFFIYCLIFLQAFLSKGFSLAAVYFPLITFYLPFLIFKLQGISFFKNYINILYIVAIYTLPLWFLQSVYPPFDNFLKEAINLVFPLGWGSTPRSLLIFTAAWSDIVYNADLGIYRNSGIFHEPGAYAIFLNLGIVMNTFLTGKRFDKKNIVFIICILTTLSTAGFITLFIILSHFLWKQRIHLFIKLTAMVVFFLVSYQTYKSEEFLQSKIQSQFEDQVVAAEEEAGKYEAKSGRFFAFYTSYNLFLKNPIIGRGIIFATSQKASGEMNVGSSYTYGLMGMFATYGIFFGLYFAYYMFRGFLFLSLLSGQNKSFPIFAFVALNLSLSTQIFISSTIFVLIFIIGLHYSYNKNRRNMINKKLISRK